MRRILKIEVPANPQLWASEEAGWASIEVPNASRVLHFAMRTDNSAVAAIWFEVETGCPPVVRRFRVFGDGDELPLWAVHVATTEWGETVGGMPLARHLFEDERRRPA